MNQPFKKLGGRLKGLRIQSKETVVEVSGAVEIEADVLEKIESGEKRPSEDILMLLISHFDVGDEDAVSLWELAGYEPQGYGDIKSDDTASKQQVLMVIPMDMRIVYTDVFHASANDYGVVLNFLQNSGMKSQPLAVARVGMSMEYAKNMVKVLQDTINEAEKNKAKRVLPAPKTTKKPKNS